MSRERGLRIARIKLALGDVRIDREAATVFFVEPLWASLLDVPGYCAMRAPLSEVLLRTRPVRFPGPGTASWQPLGAELDAWHRRRATDSGGDRNAVNARAVTVAD